LRCKHVILHHAVAAASSRRPRKWDAGSQPVPFNSGGVMAEQKPEFREDDSWFSEEQLADLTPADVADHLHSPVPTQMVSNGEYMPYPQTEKQKRVEARIKELSDTTAAKLGMTRRQFLATSGGMAACFLAMNE